jgi:hypothetical protein
VAAPASSRPSDGLSEPPVALVEPVRGWSWAWLLPLLALLLAVVLVVRAWGGRGPRLAVRAAEGHGLEAGDPLRYRGIQVGRVEEVALAPDLAEVVLAVRLEPEAAGLAREGSRFWIVRPELSLGGVQGLETLIGARYLAVLPGPEDAERQLEFVASEEAPLPEVQEPGGLEVVLEAPALGGLARGAPLLYRQIEIGTVLAAGLASDATGVEVRVHVRPAYAQLVRTDTRFFRSGGLAIDLGLGGLEVEMDSLRSVVLGGIALATPAEPGAPVGTGHRFRLHERADEDWLEWRPALPVGSALLPPGAPLPELLRARLRWKAGRFLAGDEDRSGWLLPVADGVLGPGDLLAVPLDARAGSAVLELEGERLPLASDPETGLAEGLARRALAVPGARAWPAERMRSLAEPEDLLVVLDATTPPMALAAARLQRDGEGWRVDRALVFDRAWHGAAVLARSDGRLVGLLLVVEGRGRLASPVRAEGG